MNPLMENEVTHECRFKHRWEIINNDENPLLFIRQCRKCSIVCIRDIETKKTWFGDYHLPEEIRNSKRKGPRRKTPARPKNH